ncbi:MAG: hypothetical protein WCP03_03560 [Candidatus Saccharibacteria bacterium]
MKVILKNGGTFEDVSIAENYKKLRKMTKTGKYIFIATGTLTIFAVLNNNGILGLLNDASINTCSKLSVALLFVSAIILLSFSLRAVVSIAEIGIVILSDKTKSLFIEEDGNSFRLEFREFLPECESCEEDECGACEGHPYEVDSEG